MKGLMLSASLLMLLFSCSAAPGDDNTKSSPTNVDLKLQNYSETSFPTTSYSGSSSTPVTFSVEVKNNGDDLPPATTLYLVAFCVTNVSGLNTINSFVSEDTWIAPYITFQVISGGFSAGATAVTYFNNIEISHTGSLGDNYFYVVTFADTGGGAANEANEADNIIQINASAITKNP